MRHKSHIIELAEDEHDSSLRFYRCARCMTDEDDVAVMEVRCGRYNWLISLVRYVRKLRRRTLLAISKWIGRRA